MHTYTRFFKSLVEMSQVPINRAPNPRLELITHWPITLIAELGTKLLWYGNCDIKYLCDVIYH